MVLLQYALDETGVPVLAMIADDTSAEVVYPSGEISEVVIPEGATAPAEAQGWLARIMGNSFDVPKSGIEEVSSIEVARSSAIKELRDASTDQPESSSWVSGAAGAALDDVSQDYPNVLPWSEQDEEDEDPQAMTHLVLHMLGPIDPDGPYGWIMREMDGEPAEGDDQAYLSFVSPPAEESSDED